MANQVWITEEVCSNPSTLYDSFLWLRDHNFQCLLLFLERCAGDLSLTLVLIPLFFTRAVTRDFCKKAVSYCRFPPEGIRGSAHTVVRASDYGIDEGYLSNYAEDLLIMCQVESEEGVKKAEEISAVDGVDCVQMGPLDLSASMGYLWDPGHKKVREMMRVSEKGVLKGGAYLGGFAMPHDGPIDLKARGYRMVSGTVDVGLFRSAAVDDVRKFKMSLIQGSDDEAEDGKDGDDKYWSE